MTKTRAIPAAPNDHPLVALCKSKGNNASDLRDAAHEIYHAITAGTKSWDREVVHRALKRQMVLPGSFWVHEIQARAVEQLVCKHFGYDCGSLESWIGISMMEAMRHGLPWAEMDISLPRAEKYLTNTMVIRDAEKIIAMASQKPRQKRTKKTDAAIIPA